MTGVVGLFVAADTHVNFEKLIILRRPAIVNVPGTKTQIPAGQQGKSGGMTDEQKIILLEKQVEELRRQLDACRLQKP